MLAMGVLSYHHLIANGVGVGASREVLADVILDYHLLLALLDVSPVCFKLHVQNSIASKHQLRGCRLRRGVERRVDSTSNG